MRTVLIIEDNLDMRENAAEILELEGYTVFAAENGRSGFELAKEKLPDVILCDLIMPNMNGFQVLRELKEDIFTCEIPFIFFSAKTEKKFMQAGFNLGANNYIIKPFEAPELLSILERVFQEDISK